MFELVQALHEGAEALRKQYTNSISIDAGCQLFIAFVTLFPHESAVSYSRHCAEAPYECSTIILAELQ